MTTPIVLLGSFTLLSLLSLLHPRPWLAFHARGRVAVAILFVFTGLSHFFFSREMMAMIPPFVPQRELLIYLTGLLEITAAVGLLIARTQHLAGSVLILFLVAVLPANIYAALNYTGMGNHVEGPGYLWFRIPLQLFLIAWTWYFSRSRVVTDQAGPESKTVAQAHMTLQ